MSPTPPSRPTIRPYYEVPSRLDRLAWMLVVLAVAGAPTLAMLVYVIAWTLRA